MHPDADDSDSEELIEGETEGYVGGGGGLAMSSQIRFDSDGQVAATGTGSIEPTTYFVLNIYLNYNFIYLFSLKQLLHERRTSDHFFK